MKRQKIIGRIVGIGLVLVMIGDTLGDGGDILSITDYGSRKD